jgi:hypothetical protein
MSIRRTLLIAAVTLVPAGCSSPRQLAYLNDQMNQAAAAVADIRNTMSGMQDSIDSLRTVVAKQDSTIVKLAAATNVEIVR